jgi:beta-mannosidase
VFYYLRRALQPLRVFLTDEGCNQPAIHVVNDANEPFLGAVLLRAFRKDDATPLERAREMRVEARSAVTFSTAELLEWFVDLGYVFQFGAPTYDILQAQLNDSLGAAVTDTVFLPLGLGSARSDPQLSASLDHASTTPTLTLHSANFAQCVRIIGNGLTPEDNYFHMIPGSQRTVRLLRDGPVHASVSIRDINSATPITVCCAPAA